VLVPSVGVTLPDPVGLPRPAGVFERAVMTEGLLPRAEIDVWMARLAAGEREAFTHVFEALWPRVFGLCRATLGHDADAADAAQQAMMKLMERAADYDPSRPALPWALAIAAWECRSALRRRTRSREVASSEPHEASRSADEASAHASRELASVTSSRTFDASDPESELVRRDLVRRALDAMNELSDGDRATLAATFFDEPTEVAGATLRKRRERAIDRLRAAMRRLYGLD
jgi:RNA polymerase sigma-70 factor (ECF subfamily)